MASYRKRNSEWRAEVAQLGVRDYQTFETKAAAVAWATAREVEIFSVGGEIPLHGGNDFIGSLASV